MTIIYTQIESDPKGWFTHLALQAGLVFAIYSFRSLG